MPKNDWPSWPLVYDFPHETLALLHLESLAPVLGRRNRKPGRTALVADFRLSEEDIKDIRERLKTEEKIDWERDVIVKDLNGETVAEVRKVIYIRRKDSR